jgi:hypothetical protein
MEFTKETKRGRLDATVTEDMLRVDEILKNGSYRSLVNISIDSSEISCGVAQMYGLPSGEIFEDMLDILGSMKAVRAFMKRCINNVPNRAYLIASDNTDYPKCNKLWDSLSPYKSRYKRNPNSGNKIKVWIFPVNNRRN